MGWISVKDRLPKKDNNVLIWDNLNTMFMGRYRDNVWHFYFSDTGLRDDRGRSKYVTHWMPLPEPPKDNS